MANNWQKIMDERAGQLPLDEIESQLTHQIDTFSVFGKVVEVFAPNALNIAAKFIGGDAVTRLPDHGPQEYMPLWRIPPSQIRNNEALPDW